MKHILVALIIICCAFPGPAFAAGNGPVKLIVTLMTGAAAAAAAKNADAAYSLYQEKDALVAKLRAAGIDADNQAIYSAYLQLDKNASAVKWERWIGWPNVVLEVEFAGQGSFLIPRIDMAYQGQPILENLIGKYARPGTRILVHVLDDKNFQNEVWNRILQTKINLQVNSSVVANSFLELNTRADGTFQILNKDVEIISPVCIATADFTVPDSADGRWLAEADFHDNDNNIVGKLQFEQMWSNPVIDRQKAHSSFMFLIVIAGVCFLVFAKLLFSPQAKSQDSAK